MWEWHFWLTCLCLPSTSEKIGIDAVIIIQMWNYHLWLACLCLPSTSEKAGIGAVIIIQMWNYHLWLTCLCLPSTSEKVGFWCSYNTDVGMILMIDKFMSPIHQWEGRNWCSYNYTDVGLTILWLTWLCLPSTSEKVGIWCSFNYADVGMTIL